MSEYEDTIRVAINECKEAQAMVRQLLHNCNLLLDRVHDLEHENEILRKKIQ